MALSVMEISEDDCGCDSGLPITILNKDHLSILANKYYKEGVGDPEWKLLSGNESSLIGQNIIIRSPMTCKTKNFKICKKCFGEKKTRTKYVGVTAGQCITERFTQLLMRSF